MAGIFPTVWETHGLSSPAVGRLLSSLASHRFPGHRSWELAARASWLRRWRCRLALCLQRGNAWCALARCSAVAVGDEVGPGSLGCLASDVAPVSLALVAGQCLLRPRRCLSAPLRRPVVVARRPLVAVGPREQLLSLRLPGCQWTLHQPRPRLGPRRLRPFLRRLGGCPLPGWALCGRISCCRPGCLAAVCRRPRAPGRLVTVGPVLRVVAVVVCRDLGLYICHFSLCAALGL